MIVEPDQGSFGNDAFYLPIDNKSSLYDWVSAIDPANSGTIPSNGAAVATWADRSGNGRNYTEATNKPIYTTNVLNGRPGLLFGTNKKLVGTLMSSSNYTVTLLTLRTSTNSNQICTYNGDRSTSGYGYGTDLNGGHNRVILHGGNAWIEDAAATLIAEIVTLQCNGLTTIMRVNGVAQTLTNSTVVPNAPSGQATIGASYSPTAFPTVNYGDFLEGYMFEMVRRNSAVSSTIYTADEKYIATKYGISI